MNVQQSLQQHRHQKSTAKPAEQKWRNFPGPRCNSQFTRGIFPFHRVKTKLELPNVVLTVDTWETGSLHVRVHVAWQADSSEAPVGRGNARCPKVENGSIEFFADTHKFTKAVSTNSYAVLEGWWEWIKKLCSDMAWNMQTPEYLYKNHMPGMHLS